MNTLKSTPRRHAVLVRLNDMERDGLIILREQESLPGAQVMRRLLLREVQASRRTSSEVVED